MKTTQNLIGGELITVQRHLKLNGSVTRMYSKQFYDRKFILAIGRKMQIKHLDKDVRISETNDDYILRVSDGHD